MTEQAIIQDLQRSLEAMTAERNCWKEIAHSLAKYQADEHTTATQVIEDEWHWIQRQAQWQETGDIK